MNNTFDFAPFIKIRNNIYIRIVLIFIIANAIMFIIFRKNIRIKKFHKIISFFNYIYEIIIVIVGLYKAHPFIIFSPFIIGFCTMLGYGLTKELSDEDKAGLVIRRGLFPLPVSLKARFLELVFFPGYYLLKSWKKQ